MIYLYLLSELFRQCGVFVFHLIHDIEHNKTKKQKYYTVWTFPRSYRKIVESGKNRYMYTLTNKQMTCHFPDLVQALQWKVAGISTYWLIDLINHSSTPKHHETTIELPEVMWLTWLKFNRVHLNSNQIKSRYFFGVIH